MKPVLKYPGSKKRVVNWLLEYVPEHKVYLEPFFGSGTLFFNKKPSALETINDIDGEVVNFFKVLRDNTDELYRAISMTPYARDEYISAYRKNKNEDELERARKFAIKCWMGFGCGNRYQNGFRTSKQSTSPYTTKQWNDFASVINAAAQRLRCAQIENYDAVKLIRSYNSEDVLIYADPPYLLGSRKKYLYKYEMSDSEHEELLKVLVEHKGPVMLSGYDNPLYNDMLCGWTKVQKLTTAEKGIQRTESLWMNYGYIQMSIDNYGYVTDCDI